MRATNSFNADKNLWLPLQVITGCYPGPDNTLLTVNVVLPPIWARMDESRQARVARKF